VYVGCEYCCIRAIPLEITRGKELPKIGGNLEKAKKQTGWGQKKWGKTRRGGGVKMNERGGES